jgi:FkbM family methyltransferase
MTEGGLIYDVGAHKGEDTGFYLKKGFSVVAIDASPQLCAALSQRFFDYIQHGQLKIINLAVTQQIGTVDFYIDQKNSIWGTTKSDWVARNKWKGGGSSINKITVESSPLYDLMKKHGVPRYCKVDIEGNDLDALKSLINATAVPQFISIESETQNWWRLVEEFNIMRDLGYNKFKIVDQHLVWLQKCPQPSLEGKYCDHTFEFGSSGLFGNELPGRWLDIFESLEIYKGIFRGYALYGVNGVFGRRSDLFHLLGRLQARIARLRGFGSYINPAYCFPPKSWYDTHASL